MRRAASRRAGVRDRCGARRDPSGSSIGVSRVTVDEVVISGRAWAPTGRRRRAVRAVRERARPTRASDRAACLCPRDTFPGALLLTDLPVVYGRELPGRVRSGGRRHDRARPRLFGTAFALLTCLSEVVATERDAHGRVPLGHPARARRFCTSGRSSTSTPRSSGGRSRGCGPRCSGGSTPSRFIPRMTSTGRSTRAAVSSRRCAMRLSAEPPLARERIRSLVAIKRRGRDADSCNTFEFLMDESESARTDERLLPDGRRPNRTHDPGYPLDDPWLVDVLRTIDERGHELGLHPSYETYRDVRALRQELNRVRSVLDRCGHRAAVTGGRSTTCVSSTRRPGGTGRTSASSTTHARLRRGRGVSLRDGSAVPVFDVEERRPLTLVERPLVVDEAALSATRASAGEAAAEELPAP